MSGPAVGLLHRHAFRQISGLVDVALAKPGDVVLLTPVKRLDLRTISLPPEGPKLEAHKVRQPHALRFNPRGLLLRLSRCFMILLEMS
jgi:hypothetical protein